MVCTHFWPNIVRIHYLGRNASFLDMGMKDPIPQFSYMIKTAKERFPSLAYVHVVEPRIDEIVNPEDDKHPDASNDALRAIWKPKPYIAAGGFTRQHALETADTHGNLIAFGRLFIANVSGSYVYFRLFGDFPVSHIYSFNSPISRSV
jgi:2,4-dienoyl-CoA reductase-like NADH-dependent reductase (Old Yellow Enzyme family)